MIRSRRCALAHRDAPGARAGGRRVRGGLHQRGDGEPPGRREARVGELAAFAEGHAQSRFADDAVVLATRRPWPSGSSTGASGLAHIQRKEDATVLRHGRAGEPQLSCEDLGAMESVG